MRGHSYQSLVNDIGILASTDPVALDKASLDLIHKVAGSNILELKTGVDPYELISIAGEENIGSPEYELVEV